MESPSHDPLWHIAKQRAAFKKNLSAYVVVNAFLVAVWYFSSNHGYFWPIWPMLGWGFGLLVQYLGAYRGNQWFSPEKEYEALKKRES